MKRTQIFKRVKGHVSQYEDWWYLIEEDDGSKYVEHQWDHVTVNGLSQDAGTERYKIDDFMNGNHFTGAKTALEAYLRQG